MMTQDEMQSRLETIAETGGVKGALDELYHFAFEVGYLTKAKLEDNLHFKYNDAQTGVNFTTQINVARSNYTPAPLSGKNIPKLSSPICFENIGIPGKENLRVFEFDLSGKRFFAQLTPFPLFPKHFVLISRAITPMIMSEASVVDMVNFEAMAPNYTVLSNSDLKWAGASVLTHHHYQTMSDLHLPIMEAQYIPEFICQNEETEWGLLNFPICTVLLKSHNRNTFIETAGKLIRAWRSMRDNNTCNLCFHRVDGEYRLYILLRHPDFRTPESLTHIKKEGVGIVEVCGEGIYPVPSDNRILKQIETHGLDIIKGIIDGNNPVKRESFDELFLQLCQKIA